ncbi:septum formation initiator family protein [Clostridium sp. MSJ-4]|uniref:Septum formation initiator family protein n=1 Tax=Clostridium simiarum TaxID=2841506 RepID=A0ABS6F0S9_9CLOT|nr:septum formation initiator family protein [Clostridium simiarum]MBU5592094.1 septum formation initiator family protein [Clostridium simiarum]
MKKKKLTLKSVIIILLLIFSSYTIVSQQLTMKKIKKDISNQQKELELVKEKNQKLKDEFELSNTDLYKEKQVRERLGYVKPGETPVIDSNSK